MNMTLAQLPTLNEEVPKANYPQIRTFKVKTTVSVAPLSDAVGSWMSCSPETAKDFSAVGYFFARDLHRQLSVPIGIIHSALGPHPLNLGPVLRPWNRNPNSRITPMP